MPKGGARAGAGAPLGNRNRAPKPAPAMQGRPKFESGRDFALWCLNAPDDETPMEVKIRAMQALVGLEAKAAEPKKPAPVEAPNDLYAPRKVRGFGVVTGGR